MCVIIEKKIGKEIPFDCLLSGATRNPDGYGVVIADRGQLVVFQGLADKSSAHAEEVAKILEHCKDLPSMVHFRYATAGARDVAMTHPFPLLTKADHGLDVQLMHNGTMPYFKVFKSPMSDTARFVNEVARPLFIRTWEYVDEDEQELMTDNVLQATIKALVGSGVITFMSGTGWTTKINDVQGMDYDWGWGSNKNNLEAYKLLKTKTEEKSFLPSRSWTPPEKWKTPEDKADSDQELKLALDVINDGQGIAELCRLSPNTSTSLPKPSTRLTSDDFLKPYSLEDLAYFDLEDIRKMVFDYPEAAAVCIMDLVHKLYVERKIQIHKTTATAVETH